MSSNATSSSDIPNDPLNYKNHKKTSSEDLELLKHSHYVSYSINRIVKSNSLQTDFLTSLDQFIKSLENRLDQIESLFNPKTGDKKQNDESVARLENLYDTLIAVKNSTFASSVNLQSFNDLIEAHYQELDPYLGEASDLGFHEKLLTTLHFLDTKINQFNTLVNGDTFESGNLTVEESIKIFQVKFYNYEHCLKKGESSLLHYFELPFPWRENPFIINGYRFKHNHLLALKSVCECHNETGNIWTHLLGALLMVYIAFFTYPKSELCQRSTFTDNLIIYLYLAASVKCLVSSSFWHAFSGTSNLYMRKKFACIDYTGITVLITAAVVTTEYSALYYFPLVRLGFILFSLTCGVCGFFFNWSPNFHRPESKPFRIAFYITLAGMGVIAFGILAYDKGTTHALKFYFPILRSIIWYLIGVVFYGSLVPERFRTDVILDVEQPSADDLLTEKVTGNIESYFKKEPVKTEDSESLWSLWWIDYVFNSHNIWHVFVLLGALGHYAASYEMFMNIPVNK